MRPPLGLWAELVIWAEPHGCGRGPTAVGGAAPSSAGAPELCSSGASAFWASAAHQNRTEGTDRCLTGTSRGVRRHYGMEPCRVTKTLQELQSKDGPADSERRLTLARRCAAPHTLSHRHTHNHTHSLTHTLV